MNGMVANQNKLNMYMDHVWDGFYSGQIRRSRFPGMVWGKQPGEEGQIYEIVFTGTPAKKMKFEFVAETPKAGMTIKIAYPSALSRSVLKDGEIIEYNEWDKTIAPSGMYGAITQKACGENRYIGVKNILEFYIDANCRLDIQIRDAIQTTVRMEWTMDEFFASGGTTSFVDRLCGSLGIHASTVKVISVYQGSVGIDYEITPSPDEPISIDQIRRRQTTAFATRTMDLGAPVLDVVQGVDVLVADGVTVAVGFPQVILVTTTTNQGSIWWDEWIKPFMWLMLQVVVVDMPALMFLNFESMGLEWLWNALGEEILMMASDAPEHVEEKEAIHHEEENHEE